GRRRRSGAASAGRTGAGRHRPASTCTSSATPLIPCSSHCSWVEGRLGRGALARATLVPQQWLRSMEGGEMPVTPAWHQGELTVGEVAARSGVSVSALHFYERSGLISARRTSGNQRRYRRDVLRRVALIRIAQRVGIPLADIRTALAELPDGRTPTRRDWQQLSERWQT